MRWKNVIDYGDSDVDIVAVYDERFKTIEGLIVDSRFSFLIELETVLDMIQKVFGRHKVILEYLNDTRTITITCVEFQVIFELRIQTSRSVLNAIDELYQDTEWTEEGEFYIKALKPTESVAEYKYCSFIQILHRSDTNYEVEQFVKLYDENKITKKEEVKGVVYVIQEYGNGLRLQGSRLNTKNYGEVILDQNYNDDFKPAYNKLTEFLEGKDSGLVMFKGPPGTGKSSMILHLIDIAEKLHKKFVLLPSSFGNVLTSPTFMNFALTNLQDSIIVVEDAEHILRSRSEDKGNQAVTNILNITDGLLGNLLGIKVIVTINVTDNLDDALLRKGRLKASYYFDKLETNKANKLLKALNKSSKVTEPTTLADLYNIEETVEFDGQLTKQSKIGFKK